MKVSRAKRIGMLLIVLALILISLGTYVAFIKKRNTNVDEISQYSGVIYKVRCPSRKSNKVGFYYSNSSGESKYASFIGSSKSCNNELKHSLLSLEATVEYIGEKNIYVQVEDRVYQTRDQGIGAIERSGYFMGFICLWFSLVSLFFSRWVLLRAKTKASNAEEAKTIT